MRLALVVVALALPGSAAIGQSCESYVGQSVSPLTFAQALTRIPKIEPKGEFETSAAFDARRRAASNGADSRLIIGKQPEDRKYFEYDADNQRLGIKTYAFDKTGFMAWNAFYGVDSAEALKASVGTNFDTVISTTEKVTGTYPGQNGFGAKVNIIKMMRKKEVIFDRASDYSIDGFQAGLFPAADKSPYMVGYLPLPPLVAQSLKPVLRLAFVVEPREPFVVRNTYTVGKTTVSNPTEITEDATVLIADIKCGIVTDDKNMVLGSYPTR